MTFFRQRRVVSLPGSALTRRGTTIAQALLLGLAWLGVPPEGAFADGQPPFTAGVNSVQISTFSYDADGALTYRKDVTTTRDGQTTVTQVYFTYDNFVPDAVVPSTGTVTSANGNLIAIGAFPGDASDWSALYDVQDRLVQVTNDANQTVVYRYHPDDLLGSSVHAADRSKTGFSSITTTRHLLR